jgi:hypothetical protein
MDVFSALAPYSTTAIVVTILALTLTATCAPKREVQNERVVILGASSGIGEKLAYAYAERGVRL